jgi:phenylalanyl-tRNA synthetase beta subunit
MIQPQLKYNTFEVEVESINKTLGLGLDSITMVNCIEKMGSVVLASNDHSIKVEVPPTRSDIMH